MLRKYTRLMTVMALVLTVGLAVALPSQAQEAKGKSVFVRMDTTLGPIVLELYPDKAPQTVRNFLKYALSGFYEGTIFHRVDPNFMIQGGGFDKSLIKKVGSFAPVENEAGNGLKNTEYSIAMARTSNPHSATNEFFINVQNNKALNYSAPTNQGFGYCVFGEVAAGKAVVDKIKSTPTKAQGRMPFEAVPLTPIEILKVSVVER